MWLKRCAIVTLGTIVFVMTIAPANADHFISTSQPTTPLTNARLSTTTTITGPGAGHAVAYWNQIAGWSMLTETHSSFGADIGILVKSPLERCSSNVGGCAFIQETPCVAEVVEEYLSLSTYVAHEIGHCFGWHDHVSDPSSYAGPSGVGGCGSYSGVMSYCALENVVDEEDDRNMLRTSDIPVITQTNTPQPTPPAQPTPTCSFFLFCHSFLGALLSSLFGGVTLEWPY